MKNSHSKAIKKHERFYQFYITKTHQQIANKWHKEFL